MIQAMLQNTTDGLETIRTYVVWLVKTLNEEEARDPDSPQAEYIRGELHATKWLLEVFCGRRVKFQLLEEIRNMTGLAIPHIVPLDRDGHRYGFDSDAG